MTNPNISQFNSLPGATNNEMSVQTSKAHSGSMWSFAVEDNLDPKINIKKYNINFTVLHTIFGTKGTPYFSF